MGKLLAMANEIESSSDASRDDIDWYAISNGLSTVMPDGTLIPGADEEPVAPPPAAGTDLKEDVPGLPNFLNLEHPNCMRNQPMSAIGPKEARLKELTAQNLKAAASAAAATARVMIDAVDSTKKTPTATAPAKQQETTMKTATATKTPTVKKKPSAKNAPTTSRRAAPARPAAKAAKAPKKPEATKTPSAGTRPDGLRVGSKQADMLDMALRDEGATEAAICKKLEWKKCRVTLKRVCDKVGAELTHSKNVKGETVFFAKMPAAK